jgi:hypothetical protein
MSVEPEAAAPPTEAAIIASMGPDAADPPDIETSASAISETTSDDEIVSQAAGEDQQEAEPDPNDEPPEFWSAERKALWAKIQDPEVKAAIRGHVEDASKAINGKMEEAAKARKAAEDAAKQHIANQEQLAEWWKANGSRIGQMVAGKWAGVDWNDLAANNPGEWARLRQQYESEMGQVRDMQTRHEAEVKAVEQRRLQTHAQERAAEHEKLAKKFPGEFAGEKAQKTYDTLSKYLLEQGIAPDRLQGIYEEAVVTTVLKAYKYDQLQAKAKGVTNPAQAAQPASTTPRRVQPGAARAANQGSDTERQALERLRRGEQTEDVLRFAFR